MIDSVYRKSHKHKPLGIISDFQKAARVVQSVRVDGNYKVAESKIHPSLSIDFHN